MKKTNLKTRLTMLVLLVGIHCTIAAGDVIYVDVDVSGGSDNGSSWSNAFNDLQEALDIAVAGRDIWVAAGTYYPTTEVGGTGDRYRTFPDDKQRGDLRRFCRY